VPNVSEQMPSDAPSGGPVFRGKAQHDVRPSSLGRSGRGVWPTKRRHLGGPGHVPRVRRPHSSMLPAHFFLLGPKKVWRGAPSASSRTRRPTGRQSASALKTRCLCARSACPCPGFSACRSTCKIERLNAQQMGQFTARRNPSSRAARARPVIMHAGSSRARACFFLWSPLSRPIRVHKHEAVVLEAADLGAG
jgi:hypothetical protein